MLCGTVRHETYIFPSQAQSSANLCSLCFDDVETVFTVSLFHISSGQICTVHTIKGLDMRIDRCTTFKHAIQDLIDQGLVHLGQPSVTTNSLPAHTTHAVPSPTDSMHSIDFFEFDDHIHMLS
ncbi:hypothetical protein CK203_023165 [Vitis vinifera]|uniref:Uncharacterized protein n=1 Tax=Vitis vinifera TaxID=29760 RepID=A0A438J1P4_VITVI|nr:hypothetical protein CK203_023165 [Vitis vinifera]